MKKWLWIFLLCLFISIPGLSAAQDGKFILLASTIGPIDSGIVGVLEDRFEKETGIRVRHVGAGTGAALKISEKGNIDIVMAHAKSLEEKFVKEGFCTERIPLMYNDFVIVGPAGDPAGIKGLKTASEALLNYISLIPVNAKKFPRVNKEDVKIFVAWLTSPEKGQTIIRDFGKDKYGLSLFFPNSREC
jgi:ABC-type tungstate transport system permease subunit